MDYDELTTAVRNCLKEAIFEIRSLPSPEEISDRMLFRDACKETGLSESAMRKLCMSKQIPFEKYGTRRVIFSRKALKAWMKERSTPVVNDKAMDEKLQSSAKKKIA